MGFCESFAKTLLIIFNVLFFIIGAVILGVGIWVKVDKSNLFEVIRKIKLDETTSSFDNTSNTILDVVAIVLIIFGTFTFVSGFCGCCGAIKENKCLLITYSILVGVVVIVEIGIGIYAGVEKNKFQKELGKGLLQVIKNDFNGVLASNATMFTKILTAIMFELKCCGINGEADFNKTVYNWRNNQYPPQIHPVGCCKLKNDFKYDVNRNFESKDLDNLKDSSCPSLQNVDLIHEKGCLESLNDLIQKNLAIVIGVCVGLGLFEILCIVFACCVIRRRD